MLLPQLTAEDCTAVRQLLDTALTADDLPDVVIRADGYVAPAWVSITAADPLASTRSDDDGGDAIRLALRALVAAGLAPQMPVYLSERTQAEGYQYTRQPVDLIALSGRLRQMAADQLASVLQPGSTTPNRPTLFALACGRRGA